MKNNNWNIKFKLARKNAGFATLSKLSEEMGIPLRNLQKWESGASETPVWVQNLLLEELGRISRMNMRNARHY